MFRNYVRFVFIAVTVSIVAILVIHARSYDDHGLQALLSQAGCTMPCFMGIQPGVTTRHDIIELLKTSNRFESVSTHLQEDESSAPILLIWNNTQPALMGGVVHVSIAFQHVAPQKVAQLSLGLANAALLSDLYLTFGQPSRYLSSIDSTNSRAHRYRARIIFLYDQFNMSFDTTADCPIHLAQLLRQPIRQLEYDAQMRTDGTRPMRSFRTKMVCL